jgi:hypothetical protein
VETLARRMDSTNCGSGVSGPKIDFGFSFPVGPLPKRGLSEGGSLRAARKRLFSCSRTATLSSKACKQPSVTSSCPTTVLLTSRWAARLALNARCTSLARDGGKSLLTFLPRLEDIDAKTKKTVRTVLSRRDKRWGEVKKLQEQSNTGNEEKGDGCRSSSS